MCIYTSNTVSDCNSCTWGRNCNLQFLVKTDPTVGDSIPSCPSPHPSPSRLLKVKLTLNQSELEEEIAFLDAQPPHPLAAQHYNLRRSSLEPSIFFDPTLSLLLRWCRAVSRIYGVPVGGAKSYIVSCSHSRLLSFWKPLACMGMRRFFDTKGGSWVNLVCASLYQCIIL